MVVSSDSERAVHSQKMIVELLASDMPERSYKTDNELDHWKRALGIGTPRFARRA
jgi:formate dehydrogenase major subunit